MASLSHGAVVHRPRQTSNMHPETAPTAQGGASSQDVLFRSYHGSMDVYNIAGSLIFSLTYSFEASAGFQHTITW